MISRSELDRNMKIIKDFKRKCSVVESALITLVREKTYVSIGDELLDALVASLARELNDNDNWLIWFIVENDYGRNKKTVVTVDGQKFTVRNTGDLLKVIKADNGGK